MVDNRGISHKFLNLMILVQREGGLSNCSSIFRCLGKGWETLVAGKSRAHHGQLVMYTEGGEGEGVWPWTLALFLLTLAKSGSAR